MFPRFPHGCLCGKGIVAENLNTSKLPSKKRTVPKTLQVSHAEMPQEPYSRAPRQFKTKFLGKGASMAV